MTDAEILSKLQEILAEILVLNPDQITVSSRLADDLDADSIAFLELNHRVKEDFGVEVPDPKVDEKTLVMPLLEGLERIGTVPGGSTLFDYLRGDVLATEDADARAQLMMAEAVLDGLQDPIFRDVLLRALRTAALDRMRLEDAALLFMALRELPNIGARFDELEEVDAEWRVVLTNVRAFAQPTIRPDPATLLQRWRNVFMDPHARLLMDRVTVAQFARMSGCEPPRDIAGDRRINTLRLKDLFRFVTVDSYVRYIRFLRETALREGQSV